MIPFLAVFLGGGAGASLRYLCSILLEPYGVFPHLVPNIIGTFLIGLIAVRADLISKEMALLLVVGFLGGFTTFSGYMHFIMQTNLYKGLLYIFLHHILGLAFFILGAEMSKWIFKAH